MKLLRIIVREPLLHFLLLGALIFAANAILHPAAQSDSHRIEIGKADVERIRALYAQQWGAPPDPADMPNLINNYIRSEILFREGESLGLGADDSVLRNRIMQKMEFLLQDTSSVEQPTEAEMRHYLETHAQAYAAPEQVAFTQIYFSPSLRGDRAEPDAHAMLASLGAAGGAAPHGDPSMLPTDSGPRSRAEIEEDYGPEFAASVFALPVGAWQGPIRSALGLHLVRVESHSAARLPPLAQIRNRVHDDIVAERMRAAADAAYAAIRARYQIVVAPDALSAGATASR
jgi:hypothetical protein